jgi:hypothetical protein
MLCDAYINLHRSDPDGGAFEPHLTKDPRWDNDLVETSARSPVLIERALSASTEAIHGRHSVAAGLAEARAASSLRCKATSSAANGEPRSPAAQRCGSARRFLHRHVRHGHQDLNARTDGPYMSRSSGPTTLAVPHGGLLMGLWTLAVLILTFLRCRQAELTLNSDPPSVVLRVQTLSRWSHAGSRACSRFVLISLLGHIPARTLRRTETHDLPAPAGS